MPSDDVEPSFKTGAILPNAQRYSHWAPEICIHPSFARTLVLGLAQAPWNPGTLAHKALLVGGPAQQEMLAAPKTSKVAKNRKSQFRAA